MRLPPEAAYGAIWTVGVHLPGRDRARVAATHGETDAAQAEIQWTFGVAMRTFCWPGVWKTVLFSSYCVKLLSSSQTHLAASTRQEEELLSADLLIDNVIDVARLFADKVVVTLDQCACCGSIVSSGSELLVILTLSN